jgi:hypothetical protein
LYEKIKEALPHHHKESLTKMEDTVLEKHMSFKESLSPLKDKLSFSSSGDDGTGIKATLSAPLDKAKDLHAQHWPVIKDKALQHSQSFKETVSEYHPVVKAKANEGYTKCHEFWTHPDTVDTMQKTGNGCLDGARFVAGSALLATVHFVEAICGLSSEQASVPTIPASESDQAFEATYVKLESTQPVLVEASPKSPKLPSLPITPNGSFLGSASFLGNPLDDAEPLVRPPAALFRGDDDESSPVPESSVD